VEPDSAKPEHTSAALERIHRLERTERARLEREEERRSRQSDKVSDSQGPGDTRRHRLERIERRIRFPMAALGVAWAVVGIIVLTRHSNGGDSQVLVSVLFVIWLIIVVECAVRYIVVPDRGRYFSSRRVEPAMVAVPLFQIGKLAGVEQTTVFCGEGVERFLAILRHRKLFRVLLAALALLILGAWLAMLFESKAPHSNIHTFKDAIWWAVVTVTTVGYGDRYPVTEGGRAVAVILMFVGIGLIGTLTATVASFFMQEHTDANKEQLKAAHEDLGGRLDDIDGRLARLEVAVGAGGDPAPPASGG
jgi:voltage-gated potassium channel